MSYEVDVTTTKDFSRNKLTIVEDGNIREYFDYGEPEDNSFLRDYSWIKKELRSAYIQGRMDKENECQ